MPDPGRTPPARRRPAVAGERRVRARQPADTAVDAPTESSATSSATPGSSTAPTAAAPAKRSRRRAGWGGLRLTVALLLVASLVLAAVTGAFLLSISKRNRADRAGVAALAAARVSAVDLLSYDYHHLDADFARAKTHLTGPFAQEYADTSSRVVQPTATEFQAVVSAAVTGAAVKTAGPKAAVVLVFVDQTSSNSKVPAPHIDQNRVRMTLTEVHGRWLVSKLEAL